MGALFSGICFFAAVAGTLFLGICFLAVSAGTRFLSSWFNRSARGTLVFSSPPRKYSALVLKFRRNLSDISLSRVGFYDGHTPGDIKY